MDKPPDPVTYVPPEIWVKVFEYILWSNKNNVCIDRLFRTDVHNCYQTCTTWRNILAPSKPIWILTHTFGEIGPLVAPYLTAQDMLHCRNVCKGWKLGIDTYFEHAEMFKKAEIIKKNKKPELMHMANCFPTPIKVTLFLSAMDNHVGNPFPSRTVEIYFDSVPTRHVVSCWNNSVAPLIIRFGQHVHHLRIDLRFEMGALTRLRNLLELTPNLRTLHIRGCVSRINALELSSKFPQLKYLNNLVLEQNPAQMEMSPSLMSVSRWDFANNYTTQLKFLKLDFTNASRCNLLRDRVHLPSLEGFDVTITNTRQLCPIIPFDMHRSKIKRVRIALTHRNRKDVVEKFVLGKLIDPLKPLHHCLINMTITATKSANTAVVKQSDLVRLKGFWQLEHLTITGFRFGTRRLIPYLPTSLKTLEVSSSLHFTWNAWSGVAEDVPAIDTIENRSLMWYKLPKLISFKVYDPNQRCKYTYLRSLPKKVRIRLPGPDPLHAQFAQFDVERNEVETTFTNRRLSSTTRSYCITLSLIASMVFVFFVCWGIWAAWSEYRNSP